MLRMKQCRQRERRDRRRANDKTRSRVKEVGREKVTRKGRKVNSVKKEAMQKGGNRKR